MEFRTLAAELGWDDVPFQSIFLKGLNEAIKDCLVGTAEIEDLQELIPLAIKVDNRLRERRREKGQAAFSPGTVASFRTATSPAPFGPPEYHSANDNLAAATARQEEPMQLGRHQLTPAERSRRFKEGLCIYFGQSGHQLATCPQRLNANPHQSQSGFWWVALWFPCYPVDASISMLASC